MDIENHEIDRLARELAAETGETLAEAVKTALRERLKRERARNADTGTRSRSAISIST